MPSTTWWRFAVRRQCGMALTIRGVLTISILAAAPRAARSEPAALRLSDVVAAAVRQSPELEQARIDVEAARAALVQAQGVEDTHVGARATLAASATAPTDPSGETSNQSIGLGLFGRRALSTGGELSVALDGARSRFSGLGQRNNEPARIDVNEYTTSATLALSQPLLRGAGAEAFEAPIRQAEQQRDAAALTRQARARDLVVALSQAYWEVAYGWRQLEVRKASLELAQQQLAYTEGAIRAEKVARSELLAVQQAIATRKQEVLSAEQTLYERGLALRQRAGLEIGPDDLIVTTEALPASLDYAALDQAAVLRQAFAHSAELAALAAMRRAAEVALAAANSAAKSRLDLGVTAGLIGADVTAGKALSSAVAHPGYQLDASLTYDHALEGRTERGGQAAARAAVLAAKSAERDAQARLAVRATRAVQRARAAQAKIALGVEAIDLADQNVTSERKRFELGKSTNFEVLRRQDELEQARLRHAEAVTDYLTASADLDGLSGAILARYGIVMP
jgi:outer membrane protein TolC